MGQLDFGETYRSWMAYFEREQIESIGVGLVTMRKSADGGNAFRADDAPPQNIGEIGEDILRAFDAFDFLQSVRDDERLMRSRLRVAPHVRMHQEFGPSDQGWRLLGVQLTRTQGLAYVTDTNSSIATYLHQLNGVRTVGEILEALARHRKVAVGAVAAEYLGALRPLIARGFVVPVDKVGD